MLKSLISTIFIMMQGGVDVQHPFERVGYGIGGRKSNKILKKPIKIQQKHTKAAKSS